MMEHQRNVHFHDPEEADDTLSFSVHPLLIKAESEDNELSRNQGQEIYSNSIHTPTRPSPTNHHQPPELFEFFISSDKIMCSAEDVIFCGKQSALRQRSDSLPVPFIDKSIYSLPDDDEHKRRAAFQRRSDSSPQLQSTTKTKPKLRNSQSLDNQKLHRPEMVRNLSFKGVVKSDMPLKVAAAKPQPPWSSLVFGILKVSGEMELSDIKCRQFQRIASNLDAGGKLPVSQNSDKGYWRFLKALSCNNLGSVAVTASLFEP